jgi:hypothetical protein
MQANLRPVYEATMGIRHVTDGDWAFVHWQLTFAPPPDRAAELKRLVAEDIYEAGFKALKLYFASAMSVEKRRKLLRFPVF